MAEMNYEEMKQASGVDGLELMTRAWSPEGDSRGTILILHGLAEHSARYGRFAEALVSAGYKVLSYDQRGHGGSLFSAGAYGDAGAAGWEGMSADAVAMIRKAKTEDPDKPLILFGHSMGSFVAQHAVLEASNELAGLVLSGSTDLHLVAQLVEASGEAPSFDTYNAAFAPNRTAFDWLSRDDAEVDAYVADPACGWDAPPEFAASMVAGGKILGDTDALGKIRKDLPILFVAGSADPLNGGLALLQSLKARLEGVGLSVDEQYYADGRHEMLNEINRDVVTRAIIDWVRNLH
ncbi:MAG: alpha/beta hydrolase [Pseudomonadota bacterium]